MPNRRILINKLFIFLREEINLDAVSTKRLGRILSPENTSERQELLLVLEKTLSESDEVTGQERIMTLLAGAPCLDC